MTSLSCRPRWSDRSHGAALARTPWHARSSLFSCLALLSCRSRVTLWARGSIESLLSRRSLFASCTVRTRLTWRARVSGCARLAWEARQAPFSRDSPISFQAHSGEPRWTWLAWRTLWPKMPWGSWSSLGSHGTGLTLCPWPATAARRTGFSTVTLRPREARMTCFPLEAWRSHESGRASRTWVPPQARLAVLPVQSVQPSRALNPGRAGWPRGPRQA